jgi:hypothetical protein
MAMQAVERLTTHARRKPDVDGNRNEPKVFSSHLPIGSSSPVPVSPHQRHGKHVFGAALPTRSSPYVATGSRKRMETMRRIFVTSALLKEPVCACTGA